VSGTPRTDAAWGAKEAGDYPRSEFVVPLEFARQLEREISRLKAQLYDAQADIDEMECELREVR
jgi:hypothetical protein